MQGRAGNPHAVCMYTTHAHIHSGSLTHFQPHREPSPPPPFFFPAGPPFVVSGCQDRGISAVCAAGYGRACGCTLRAGLGALALAHA